jgi:hypothetical protein
MNMKSTRAEQAYGKGLWKSRHGSRDVIDVPDQQPLEIYRNDKHPIS